MDVFRNFIASCQQHFARRERGPAPTVDDPCHLKAASLKRVANLFLDGFGVAFEDSGEELEKELNTLPQVDRGVAYEGAAAGKAVLDLTMNAQFSEANLLLTDAQDYSFLIFLGIGEALAQLRFPPQLCNSVAAERWSGQVIEGYGFFDGYFNWYEAIIRQRYPQGLDPGLRSAYDQGLGRAIFFITNCNPAAMRDNISYFQESRRPEIWSGAGVPTAYVGGPSERDLKKLLQYAGPYRAEFMQGIMLGASARTKQSFIPDHTDMACNIICGDSTKLAVEYSDRLSELMIERERFSMFDWQSLVRRELKHDAR